MNARADVVHLGGVVLAAGASTRMGRAKAELIWRGLRFVDHCVALLHTCTPTVVVTGALPLEVGATRIVHNEHWADGQFSSLRVGLAALPRGHAAMVVSVDRPHVRPDTVGLLVDAFEADPTRIVQPSQAGKHGHPILLPADIVTALLAWPATGTAREVVREFPDRRFFVEVDDPAVVDNLDRPGDLARLPA